MSVRVHGKTFMVGHEDTGEKYLVLNELGITNIAEIDGLDNHTDLKRLDLSNNQITKIEGLDKLRSLEILVLSHNQIPKIESLDKLPFLDSIELTHNLILKIEGLGNLPLLQTIFLENNQVMKIEGLDHLPKLRVLALSNNQVAKIEGLGNLPSLQFLNLAHNKVTRIEGLGSLTRLYSLSLTHNQIQKLEGLGRLTELGELNLAGNPLIWPAGFSPASPPADIVAYCQAVDQQIELMNVKKYLNFMTTVFTKNNITFKDPFPFYVAFGANVEDKDFGRLEVLGNAILNSIITELVLNENESINRDNIQQISAFLTTDKIKVEYCDTLQVKDLFSKPHSARIFGAFIAAIHINNGYDKTKAWLKSTLLIQRIGQAIEGVK